MQSRSALVQLSGSEVSYQPSRPPGSYLDLQLWVCGRHALKMLCAELQEQSGNDICQKRPKRTKPPWQHQTEPKQKESLISITQFWQIIALPHMSTSWGLKDSLCWNRIGNGIQCKFLLYLTPTVNSWKMLECWKFKETKRDFWNLNCLYTHK